MSWYVNLILWTPATTIWLWGLVASRNISIKGRFFMFCLSEVTYCSNHLNHYSGYISVAVDISSLFSNPYQHHSESDFETLLTFCLASSCHRFSHLEYYLEFCIAAIFSGLAKEERWCSRLAPAWVLKTIECSWGLLRVQRHFAYQGLERWELLPLCWFRRSLSSREICFLLTL